MVSGCYDAAADEDPSGDVFLFQVAGPRSLDLTEAATGETLRDIPPGNEYGVCPTITGPQHRMDCRTIVIAPMPLRQEQTEGIATNDCVPRALHGKAHDLLLRVSPPASALFLLSALALSRCRYLR